jgi:cysteine-rich repeat protein
MTKFLGRAVLSVLLLSAISPAASGLDANGKWRFDFGGPPFLIVPVTQTGSTLSFVLSGLAFSGSLSPAGSFTNYEASAGNPVMAVISGRFMPSGNLLDGRAVDGGFPPSVSAVVATRCTCDDGNTTSGDGCDAECRVEPCWTCNGELSVCTPAGEGSACEDGSACTTGETCTSGACGGGAPASPCVDMTGQWIRHTTELGSGLTYDTSTDIVQRGTDLFIAPAVNYVTDAYYVGTIDPASGAFDVRGTNPNFFCFSSFDPMLGSVAPSGVTYVADGSFALPHPSTPDLCDDFAVNETGSRSGSNPIGVPSLSRSGMILLMSTLLLSAIASRFKREGLTPKCHTW